MNKSGKDKTIVIIGGGIIGCLSAYYLTRHPAYDRTRHSITLFEATGIAGGASGKAGGLVAAWADPPCIAPLSHRLHEDLAKEYDGEARWGWRKVHCLDCEAIGQYGKDQKKSGAPLGGRQELPPEVDWIIPSSIKSFSVDGSPTNSAQLHPYQFTNAMIKLAQEAGVEVILATVTSIQQSGGRVSGVEYTRKGNPETQIMTASHAVVAAGPWTPFIFPPAPIKTSRNHSVVLKPARDLSEYVLFLQIQPGPSGRPKRYITPEIYPRPDHTVYACGPEDTDVPLPATTDEVEVDTERALWVRDAVGSLSELLDEAKVDVMQACYRPQVDVKDRARDTGPLLGWTDVSGLILATGHDSWGVSNSTASGKLVSELVFDGKATSADISSLDPRPHLRKGEEYRGQAINQQEDLPMKNVHKT